MTDPIADFITRLKNGSDAGHSSVSVPFSKVKLAIAEVLKRAGYIMSFEKHGKRVKKTLEVVLGYDESKDPRINGVRRYSKLSRRVYVGSKDIKAIKRASRTTIISTPLGIMTGTTAQKQNVGGEVLFEIW